MLNGNLLARVAALCAFLLVPGPAFAVTQLILSSETCDGVFVLKGANLNGVHGVDVQVAYDPLTLSNPRIEMGTLAAGTMNAANRGNPVRIMMISGGGMKGNGTLATITFDRVGTSAGAITQLKAGLSDLYGRTLPVQPLLVPTQMCDGGTAQKNGDGATDSTGQPSQSTGQPAQSTPQTSSQPTESKSGAGSGRSYLVGGNVKMAQNDEVDMPSNKEESPYKAPEKEEQPKPEPAAPTPAAPTSAPNGESPAPKAAQPPVQPQKVVSVLERFRLFQGEKTLPALAALFKGEGGGLRQYPAIAVSDGVSTVKVVIPKAAGEKTPNFTFHSAKFISVAPAADGGWEVEVRPERGTVDAAVAMLTDAGPQEYPVTVTPRPEALATKSPEALESEFASFIKEEGKTSAVKYDLNGDGKRDYIDEYIFTANYLLKVAEREKHKPAPRPAQ